MNRERRCLARQIEVRAAGKAVTISGYAAVFYDPSDPAGTQYRLWGETYERIMPGAFANALKRPDDVRCLFNHNVDCVLGRTVAGTLSLSVDSIGLRFTAKLPDTDQARSIAESIRRGDVSGCSFSFQADAVTWREDGEATYREITDVSLFDVGPVTFPGYTGTDVSVAKRSFEQRSARPAGEAPRATLAAMELENRMQRALRG